MDAVITIEADLNAIIKEVCIGKYKFQQNLKSVYCLYLQPCMVMHLSAAISGGWPRGTPEHLHNDVYKSPLPKRKIF